MIPTAVPSSAGHDLRLYTCPECSAQAITPTPPAGWWILSPFERVVACSDCRPAIERRHAMQRVHGRDA